MGLWQTMLRIAAPPLIAMATLSAFPPSLAAQTGKDSNVRVGKLSNSGELRRYKRRVLQACGYEPIVDVRKRSSDETVGEAIGQFPAVGTRVGCSETGAILYLSAGPLPPTIYVPSLVEERHRANFEAYAGDICQRDLSVAVRRVMSSEARGQFLSQSPAQGQVYQCGTPVSVAISAGRAMPVKADVVSKGAAPDPGSSLKISPPASPAPPISSVAEPAMPPATTMPADQAIAEASPAISPEIEEAPISLPTATPAYWPWIAAVLLLLGVMLGWKLLRRRSVATPLAVAMPAPLMLQVNRPLAAATMAPAERLAELLPGETLPPDPIVEDILRNIDLAIDWIAQTAISDASATAIGSYRARGAGGETLEALREPIGEGLREALMFELAPIIGDTWARARHFPLVDGQGGQGGSLQLAPHTLVISLYPDFQVTAAGIPLFRLDPCIELRLQLPAAGATVRGRDLVAIQPGAISASASLRWLGANRTIPLSNVSLAWSASTRLNPPRLVHALLPLPQQGAL